MQVKASDFERMRLCGEGGSGLVYLVRLKSTTLYFALKVCDGVQLSWAPKFVSFAVNQGSKRTTAESTRSKSKQATTGARRVLYENRCGSASLVAGKFLGSSW